jgi:hypothetical protein
MADVTNVNVDYRLRGRDYSVNPADADLRVLPDGALPVGDWFAALVMRGLAWHATIGGFSTPIVGGGNGTIIDLDQPEGLVSVPRGWTMVPLRIDVQVQVPLLATDSDENEILIAVDRANAWSRDGTRTDESAYNMRTDLGDGCPLLVASAFTADMTADSGADTVHHIELARSVMVGDVQGTPATVVQNVHRLLYEPLRPPLLVGPALMTLYWGGTVATSGFALLQFAAVRSSLLTGLQ